MPRHKFQAINGAVAVCESCGVLNNLGVVGCIAEEGKLINYELISLI
jgi:hypothetical protein